MQSQRSLIDEDTALTPACHLPDLDIQMRRHGDTVFMTPKPEQVAPARPVLNNQPAGYSLSDDVGCESLNWMS
jgi:hypothetical protein